MLRYYVNTNAQPTGEHEVHTIICPTPPHESIRRQLGSFDNCHEAVNAARATYDNVDGCKNCVPQCHTR